MNKKIKFLICCIFMTLNAISSVANDNIDNPTYIIGHWNYPPNSVNPIYVVSDGEYVELFINGITTGHGRHESKYLYSFDNIIFQPGTLTAVSYDADGKEMGRYSLVSSGIPAQIKLSLLSPAEDKQASEVKEYIIQCEITDFYGKRCFADDRIVQLEIEEPHDWDKSPATTHGKLISKKQLSLHNGENCITVKKPAKPGEIKITAKAPGLAETSLNL